MLVQIMQYEDSPLYWFWLDGCGKDKNSIAIDFGRLAWLTTYNGADPIQLTMPLELL